MRLSTGERWEVCLLACLAFLVAAAAVAGGRFDFVISTGPIAFFDESCTPASPNRNLLCQLAGDWERTGMAWTLPPGRSGSIVGKVDLEPDRRLLPSASDGSPGRDARLLLSLYADAPSGAQARIALSGDGRTFAPAGANLPFDGTRIEVASGSVRPGGQWAKVFVHNGATGRDAAPLTLSRVRFIGVKTPHPVPNVAMALMLVITPLLAYRVRQGAGGRKALFYALAVLCGMAILLEAIGRTWTRAEDPIRWWELVTDGQERDLYLSIPYLLLLGLLGWRRWAGQPGASSGELWTGFALAGVFIWGLSRRLVSLAQALDVRLDPDVLGNRQLAGLLASPYETYHREPLWIWITRGWLDLVGWGGLQLRLLSLVFSLLMIAAAYKFFRDYTGRPVIGGLVAFLLCLNPYLIRLNVRGLREEAYATAVLVVAYVVLVRNPKLSLRAQAVGLALGGAAMQLLRFNSYVLLIPLLLVWLWQNGARRWGYALLPALFVLAVSLPHAAHNASMFGDPFYSVNIHFSWFRNYEFVVKKDRGCEGCPTREEFFLSPYAGPPVTAFHYVFGMHSLREVVGTTLEGYQRMYLSRTDWFEMQTGTRSRTGYALYLLGLGLALAGSYRGIVVLIILLANLLPFIMMYEADLRLGTQTVPFATFLLAYGAWWLFEQTAGAAAWAARSPALAGWGLWPRPAQPD